MPAQDPFSDSLELLARAKLGDGEALQALLGRFRDRLLARIRLMMGPRAQRVAESGDFLQEVFAEVLEGFRRFELRDERSFMRWMTAIARNSIRDSVRRRRERAFESLSDSVAAEAESDRDTPSPVSQADLNDKLCRLAEALEELEEAQRELIAMRDLEGMTFQAIADHLGCSKNGARLQYNRALVALGGIIESRAG